MVQHQAARHQLLLVSTWQLYGRLFWIPRSSSSSTLLHLSGTPKIVFVTGATDFVGAFMVHEFLKRDLVVYYFVRAGSLGQAHERMVKKLKQYSLWKPK